MWAMCARDRKTKKTTIYSDMWRKHVKHIFEFRLSSEGYGCGFFTGLFDWHHC